VERVYLIALGRSPGAAEKELGLEALRRLGDGQKALARYCHAVMNSAAFLYVD
jgi:hypothetical protein